LDEGLDSLARSQMLDPSVRGVAAKSPKSGVSAGVLPVELFPRCEDLAHMSARPQAERFDGLPQSAAELGQFVIDTLRTGGEDRPRHQAVSLQSTQREGEHPLRNTADHPLDLAKALRAIADHN